MNSVSVSFFVSFFYVHLPIDLFVISYVCCVFYIKILVAHTCLTDIFIFQTGEHIELWS